jgi:hypothetical protein
MGKESGRKEVTQYRYKRENRKEEGNYFPLILDRAWAGMPKHLEMP